VYDSHQKAWNEVFSHDDYERSIEEYNIETFSDGESSGIVIMSKRGSAGYKIEKRKVK
jgi:hypothetical protein